MNTWLCKSARSFANLQIPLHVCITACLFAAGLACMHGGVFMCKGPCIGAERRAGLHASVLLCAEPRVYFAPPHARVHVSPDHFQGKLAN